MRASDQIRSDQIGADSVSSRVGSGQGLDGVGDGPGSCLGASR